MKKILLTAGLLISTLTASDLTEGQKLYENKQYEKAYTKFLNSAKEGMISKYNIGIMHEFGRGVKKNIKNAIYFYNLSANDGYDKAQNALGNAYLKGVGVKKDINKAIAYYTLAAKQKNKDAILTLKNLKKQIDKEKKEKDNYGKLTVRSNVNKDEVYINGKNYGKTPVTLSLKHNTNHQIEVRKKGYQTYKFKDFSLKPKEKKTIRAILKR